MDYEEIYYQERMHIYIIGISQMSKLLIVCHCCREIDIIVRIVSARKPTKKETEYVSVKT